MNGESCSGQVLYWGVLSHLYYYQYIFQFQFVYMYFSFLSVFFFLSAALCNVITEL